MALKPLLAAFVFSLLAGCAMQDTGSAPTHAAPDAITVTADTIGAVAARSGDAYLVGRGDVLQIHAIDAPELTAPAGYEVGADGTIEVPFLGAIPAADREPAAIRTELTRRLQAYLPDPQLDLRVTDHAARQISVVGAVNRPGRQVLTTRPLSVIDAINAAGGFATTATPRGVTILRAGREIAVDIRGFLEEGRALPMLRDGDVVQVGGPRLGTARAPRGITVALDGQPERVIDPGATRVSVADLIARLGTPGHAVQVIRHGDAPGRVYLIRAADAAERAVGGRFMLADGDRVELRPAIDFNS